MEYRRLGSAGLKLSAISIGSWATFGQHVDDATAREILKTALDGGINFIDNAEIYGDGASSAAVGRLTHGLPRRQWLSRFATNNSTSS